MKDVLRQAGESQKQFDVSRGVVAIDDSGTPGTSAKSATLHLNRKSWIAVIVPPLVAQNVAIALDIFIRGVRQDFGATELHFTDIYSGRKAFKGIPIKARYELFGLMTQLFEGFRLPIIVQTCSPEFLREWQRLHSSPFPDTGWFKPNNHEHMGLRVLLWRVREFMREERGILPNALPVIVDAGLMKSGASIPLPGWADSFAGGCATFHHSHEVPFLQLADFAAFVLARTQWLVSAGVTNDLDKEFLRIVSADKLWFVNLGKAYISPNESSGALYEELLREDRLLKGLPDDMPQ